MGRRISTQTDGNHQGQSFSSLGDSHFFTAFLHSRRVAPPPTILSTIVADHCIGQDKRSYSNRYGSSISSRSIHSSRIPKDFHSISSIACKSNGRRFEDGGAGIHLAFTMSEHETLQDGGQYGLGINDMGILDQHRRIIVDHGDGIGPRQDH